MCTQGWRTLVGERVGQLVHALANALAVSLHRHRQALRSLVHAEGCEHGRVSGPAVAAMLIIHGHARNGVMQPRGDEQARACKWAINMAYKCSSTCRAGGMTWDRLAAIVGPSWEGRRGSRERLRNPGRARACSPGSRAMRAKDSDESPIERAGPKWETDEGGGQGTGRTDCIGGNNGEIRVERGWPSRTEVTADLEEEVGRRADVQSAQPAVAGRVRSNHHCPQQLGREHLRSTRSPGRSSSATALPTPSGR